ncbi:hypothetical protein Sj15T_38490 [Sphingobium sp. TA15]|uniref:Arginine deiminase n=2 Tax=Sphingobium indicum TaxID=332055 RepID=A0A8E0WPB7_9SPHN|nr:MULTISPECIES: nuclear transport factor 2 family protein [Sphingobium]EPR15190.1 arginine deiminase [Sphingobium indicum IP26]BDD68828.1 hypothetical protein Sj15T_38490 [Sphingobium sp. TA15]EQB03074.1 arginine deiminase [Sphingobium sp. HDIP04]KER34932.1 arginine deiminase [Sphingobium indicum F2]BAI98781.1 putative aromatic ring hydroxylating dioxygenase beta subunit [Sphingobium indicum UT26S]
MMSGNDEAYRACTALISAFAHHVDHREFDKAVALFAADGCFERADITARGHAEIAALWADRPVSLITRHLCSLPHFTKLEADAAESITGFTLYHVNHEDGGLPRFEHAAGVGEFHDRFVRTPGGWRIAHRRGVPVLIGGH